MTVLWLAAAHDELVGRLDQRPHERIVHRRGVARSQCGARSPPTADRSAIRGDASSVDAITAARGVSLQVEAQHQRIEQVFPIVEAALPLHVVLEVAIPVPGLPHFAAWCAPDAELRQPWIRRARHQPRFDLDGRIERAVLVGRAW